MAEKTKISLILIFFLILISLLIQIPTHDSQSQKFPLYPSFDDKKPLTPSYSDANRTLFWVNFTNTGDFVTWTTEVGFSDWDDTGDHLYAKTQDVGPGGSEDYAYRDLSSWELYASDLNLINLTYSVKVVNSNGDAYGQSQLFLYFTDASFISIFNHGNFGGGTTWYNYSISINVTGNKIIQKLRLKQSAGSFPGVGTGSVETYLFDENYHIYLPYLNNFEISPSPELNAIELGDLVNFKVDVYPNNPTYEVELYVEYIPTGTIISYDMAKEPFDTMINYKFLTFNLSGVYSSLIRITTPMNKYVYSQTITFIVYEIGEAYPKSTYLSLWSPYDDLSLSGKLKTYLGADECYKITDFKNEYGYGTNLTWRPIHEGIPSQPSYSVMNNRLYLQVIGNGVEADLEDTINITYYDSLKFSLKVTNLSSYPLPTKVFSIVMNPSSWEADYRLNLSNYISYLNQWVTFIIPWQLFTYIYPGEALQEIGFHSPESSGLLDCQIKDVYACHYNLLEAIINDTGETFTTNESMIRTDLSPLHFSIENTTSSLLNATLNQTFDETLAITEFGDYQNSSLNVLYSHEINGTENEGINQATFNFKNDADWEDPANFSITEPSGTSIQVRPSFLSWLKVLEINDTSSTNSPNVAQTFSSSQIYGSVYTVCTSSDLTVLTGSANGWASIIRLWESSTPKVGIFYGKNNHIWYYSAGSLAESSVSYANNQTQLFRLDFDCGTDTYSAYTLNVTTGEILETICSAVSFNSVATSLTLLDQYVGSNIGGKLWIYAIDYNWTNTHYTNRICNWETNATGGYYLSNKTINPGHYFNITALDYSSSSQQNASIELSFHDYDSGDWVNTTNYINSLQQFIQFNITFNSPYYSNNYFFNLSINYTYSIYNFSQNFTKSFDIPQNAIINFTFDTFINSNRTLLQNSLYLLNYSSDTFIKVGDINTTLQKFTFSSNLSFFSEIGEFTFKINATDNFTQGFQITQLNYSIIYYRFQFDRQVKLSETNITSYSNTLYGFCFESDFTNDEARTSLYFELINGSYIEMEQFEKDYNYTLFRQFADYGLTFSLIQSICFNFTLFNCSSLNDANVTLSKFYLYFNESYRLISDENRMYGDVLSFDSEIESLCLTDYWGDVIFREQLNRTAIGSYYDILIPYFTIKFINYFFHDIIVRVEKNNVIREYRVLASSELEVSLILDDYKLVRVTNVDEILIYEGTLSRTTRGAFEFGQLISFIDWESIITTMLEDATNPPSLWDQMWSDPWFIIIFTIIPTIITFVWVVTSISNKIKQFETEIRKSGKFSDEEIKRMKNHAHKKTEIKEPKDINFEVKKRRYK